MVSILFSLLCVCVCLSCFSFLVGLFFSGVGVACEMTFFYLVKFGSFSVFELRVRVRGYVDEQKSNVRFRSVCMYKVPVRTIRHYSLLVLSSSTPLLRTAKKR